MAASTRQYLFTSESVTEGHPDMSDAAGLAEVAA
jgi:S-adenosylmethionine synthetase